MSKKILVVDDDHDILDAVRFILTDAGYNVTISQKGETAEMVYKHQKDLPNLIILDVLLSGKDGREICRKLKNDSATKHIPIIMFSAHPNIEESTKKSGADGFLAKPFNVDVLLKTVETYCAEKQ